MHKGVEKYVWLRNLKEGDSTEDLDVDERIIEH